MSECGGARSCVAIEQELSSPADGRMLVEKAVAALGRLDILVANHGVWEAEDVPIAEMSEAQWRQTLAVNLDSVFGLVQAAVAQMSIARSSTAYSSPLDKSVATGHIVLIRAII